MSKRPLRILVILGSRPDFIKLWPLVAALRRAKRFKALVCSTGQHREMLKGISSLFPLSIDHDLGAMVAGQDMNQLALRILEGVAAVIRDKEPDLVIVQGDTTSALMAALAAFHANCPILHVEAGLRSGRRDQPFPEETNRTLIGHMAVAHCAPTQRAVDNLRYEGIVHNVWLTGNTIVDALKWALQEIDRCPEPRGTPWTRGGRDSRLILATCHRRESIGEPLQCILRAFKQIALAFPSAVILLPVHFNPNVREPVFAALGKVENIMLVEPLSYADLLRALRDCHFVLSDSGGLQEEAPALGKPILVLRNVTERVEGIAAGNAKLVGTDEKAIVSAATELLTDEVAYARMAKVNNLYGDGKSASRIIEAIDASFGASAAPPGLSPGHR